MAHVHECTEKIESATADPLQIVADHAASLRHCGDYNQRQSRFEAIEAGLVHAEAMGHDIPDDQVNISAYRAVREKKSILLVMEDDRGAKDTFQVEAGQEGVYLSDNEYLVKMNPKSLQMKDPSSGFWTITFDGDAEPNYMAAFDFHEEIVKSYQAERRMIVDHEWMVRLPLFTEKMLDTSKRYGLPVHEVHVRMTSHYRANMPDGQKISVEMCSAYLCMYGRPESTMAHPCAKTMTKVSKTGLYTPLNFSPYQSPPQTVHGYTKTHDSAKEVVSAIKVSGLEKVVFYANQNGKQLTAIEDNSEMKFYMGSTGRVLFSVAYLEYVATHTSDLTVDLNDPELLHRLLKKSKADNVIDALNTLYGPKVRRDWPSVAQLLGDVSGLPEHLPLTTMHLKAAVVEESSAAAYKQEKLFASILKSHVQLVASPGAMVQKSSVGYALLAFTLPDHEKSVASLAPAYSAMGLDSITFWGSEEDEGYEGVYTLTEGMQVKASEVAAAFSKEKNNWFEVDSNPSAVTITPSGLDFLPNLLYPRFVANKKDKVCSGYGWKHKMVKSVHVAYAHGEVMTGKQQTLLVMVPSLGASAFLGIQEYDFSSGVDRLLDSVVDYLIGSVSSMKVKESYTYVIPAVQRQTLAHMRYSSAAVQSSHSALLPDGLPSYEMVDVFDSDTTLSITIVSDRDGGRSLMANVEQQETRVRVSYPLAWDRNACAMPGSKDTGAFRTVLEDSMLGDYMYLEKVRINASTSEEVMVSFMGHLFVKKETLVQFIAFADAGSDLRARASAEKKKLTECHHKKTKTCRRRTVFSDESDDEEDSDGDYSDDEESPTALRAKQLKMLREMGWMAMLGDVRFAEDRESMAEQDIGGHRGGGHGRGHHRGRGRGHRKHYGRWPAYMHHGPVHGILPFFSFYAYPNYPLSPYYY